MEKKKNFRVPTFINFLVAISSGGYLAYLQLNKSQDLTLKIVALVVFVLAMYLSSRNWVSDNPGKNKKNWSDSDRV